MNKAKLPTRIPLLAVSESLPLSIKTLCNMKLAKSIYWLGHVDDTGRTSARLWIDFHPARKWAFERGHTTFLTALEAAAAKAEEIRLQAAVEEAELSSEVVR